MFLLAMSEKRDFDLNDLNDISDDQERLHFQLSLQWENGKIDLQKVKEQFHELYIAYEFIFQIFLILQFLPITIQVYFIPEEQEMKLNQQYCSIQYVFR